MEQPRDQLLLRAAEIAVGEHQAGRTASVADILHLEKRWSKLPGASTGKVALEDAKGLLGQEVLAGEPLEYVVRQVFPDNPGLASLSKRQFLALAYVVEVAQSKAFDLVTAEDAQRCQPPTAASKKRAPVSIRDTHIDTWQISARPAPASAPAEAPQPQKQQGQQGQDVGASASGSPAGQLPPGGTLSRATSLHPLPAHADLPEPGLPPLSAQASLESLGAVSVQLHQQLPGRPAYFPSGNTSYQSAVDAETSAAEGADGDADDDAISPPSIPALGPAPEGSAAAPGAAAGGAALPLDAQVDEFTSKLNGLVNKMSNDMARYQPSQPPAGDAAAGAPSMPALSVRVRSKASSAATPRVTPPHSSSSGDTVPGSWESFNTPKAVNSLGPAADFSAAAAAAAGMPAAAAGAFPPLLAPAMQQLLQQQAAAAAAGGDGTTTPRFQQPTSEAMMAAAMAAGMTFMQHLQAAQQVGQASPFSELNPLRGTPMPAGSAMGVPSIGIPVGSAGGSGEAAAVAGTAAAGAGAVPPSPASVGMPMPGAGAGVPGQQALASMLSNMNLGAVSAEELQEVARALQQKAQALQQAQQTAAAVQAQQGRVQQQQQVQQEGSSRQGSAGSVPSADQQQLWEQGGQRLRQQHAQQPQKQQQRHSHQQQAAGGRHARQGSASGGQQPVPISLPRPAASNGSDVGIAGWDAMTADDLQRAEAIFKRKGYPALGGMEKHNAMEYFGRLHMEPAAFHQAWQAADMDRDGCLNRREFCLFVQLLRGAQKGRVLPAQLSAEEVAALLGERPMPGGPVAGSAVGSATGGSTSNGQQPMYIDTSKMRSALGHSRHTSLGPEPSVLQDFEDDASSASSGIAESVCGMPMSTSRPAHHHRPSTLHSHNGVNSPPRAASHLRPGGATRSGLGSVLGGGVPSSVGPSASVAAYGGANVGMASAAGVGGGAERQFSFSDEVSHSVLEVAVRSAEIKYSKALTMPIFTISVRDSLGRLVELPIDTHPGHYRKETAMIHSSAIVRLTSQLRSIPPGSILFVEIKHWKSEKKAFSTLAWSFAPLEKFVDFGPVTARVRNGPVDLPLFKKPMDLSLRKTKRLTSRAYDLHLTVRGIE